VGEISFKIADVFSSQAPMLVMLIFIVAVQLLAISLMPAFSASGNRIFENPESTANPFIYILLIIGFTVVLLIAMKLEKGWLVSGFIQLSVAATIFYILSSFVDIFLSLILTLALLLLLRFYPEWYIIDIIGILICAGISSLFGISMTALPAFILLVILAIYDAISVYKTRHMVTSAEGVIDIKAPLLFVVPRKGGYSFRKERMKVGGEGRGAYFLGLGDAIIPTILAVSANWSVPAPALFILGLNLPALGAMFGTWIGFGALLMTSRDKPQAGLPFLNGGTVLGFLAGCALAGVRPF
jgi:presenilin-like A22 family membrane protease